MFAGEERRLCIKQMLHVRKYEDLRSVQQEECLYLITEHRRYISRTSKASPRLKKAAKQN